MDVDAGRPDSLDRPSSLGAKCLGCDIRTKGVGTCEPPASFSNKHLGRGQVST